ncbi:MAG: DUF3467 domain-containing protein [Paludibacteraceae bacterium]|nr:DUF3467 domain-containing protein [Paludibacteraceae bacterium]
MEDQNEKKQLNIELSEEVADGVYSNLAIISHSSSEFVLDFVRIMPNTPKAKVKSRIILTPAHAKHLMLALQDNVRKYEQQFGTIDGTAASPSVSPYKFNGFNGGGEA